MSLDDQSTAHDAEEQAGETGPRKGLTRRQVILGAWGVVGAAAAAQMAGVTFRFLAPGEAEAQGGGKLAVGRVDDFPAGSVTYVAQGQLFLVRTKQWFLALSQVCTHLACAVQWNEEAGRFECHCHGAVFNEKGEVLAGPPPRPLDYYPVEVSNGMVIVDTSKVAQRSEFNQAQATEV
ncbi:MAG: ubiquinol-cytochrome c reductase iron-sulfur subunit [Chloroflexi bacterium]|nr:ubiquinol-cytochrome c reductase iron-sulfur subunit [Chloroflexota bacterium]